MSDEFATAQGNTRLIVHIGAGKTGTSSIQKSLTESKKLLNQNRYDYWGLMLELAPIQRYSWQHPARKQELLNRPPDEIADEVADVCLSSVRELEAQGYHGAIWSNETFFDNGENMIPGLKMLQRSGVDIDVIAYVRRHDAWAESAYVQWGIKHKTYAGELISFNEFVRRRPVRFFDKLKPWIDAFADRVIVRNYDSAEESVSDFLKACRVPVAVPTIRSYDSPSNEELLLRAIYNNSISDHALPMAFDRQIRAGAIDFEMSPHEWMTSLLPSNDELENVVNDSASDREKINHLLREAGQQPLELRPREPRQFHCDFERLNATLVQLIFQQSKRLQRLERDYSRLKEVLDDMSNSSG